MNMNRFTALAVGRRLRQGALLLLLLALVAPIAPLYAAPPAQIPPTLNYQGTLRDAQGNLINGKRDITFKIYGAASGGSPLFTEEIKEVTVRDGLFNVVLGDGAALNSTIFAGGALYIGVAVGTDAEMTPRQRLHPVPWAHQATAATTLNPNATISGGVTLQNGKWTLNTADKYWDIQPDASGILRFVYRNSGFLRLGINPNGNVQVPGDFYTRSVFFDNGAKITSNGNSVQIDRPVNVNGEINSDARIVAALGFNGKCANSLNSVGQQQTCDQDIAETFATDQRTEAGDLVVFIPEDRAFPAVQRATQPYEAAIVGVVSTKPGLVFDQGETILAGESDNLISNEKTVVAMVGRVPTKFSLENGPIAVGDPLASSSTPGAAMKATQAGRIIGYAMQSSDAAEDGKLLVWLQASTYIPAETLAAINSATLDTHSSASATSATADANLEATVAALRAELDALKANHRQSPWSWPLSLMGLMAIGVVVATRNRF